jgi:hypothetical protein
VVPIRSRRRARGLLLQKLQHAAPSVVLLGDGLTRLGRGDTGAGFWLGLAEVAIGAVVIGSFIRAMRGAKQNVAAPHGGHHGPDWLDLFLGAMLIVEAVVHQHETGHLPRPTLLMAAVMVVLGLAHGRIATAGERRRSLQVSDAGVTVGGRFFTRFTASWDEIADVRIDAREAAVVTRDGRTRRFNLADISNLHEVQPVLEQIASRHQARLESQ